MIQMNSFGFNNKKKETVLVNVNSPLMLLLICSLTGTSFQLGLESFLQRYWSSLLGCLSIQCCPWCLPCFYPKCSLIFRKNPFLSPR